MKSKYLLLTCLIFCFPLYYVNAQDKDTTYYGNYTFAPSIAGGQFELTTLLFVVELGALVDVDLFTKKSKIDYSFGTRFSFESYGYLEPGGPTGGGPFKDYCFYVIHSGRSKNFHFNLLGGLAYHTRASDFYEQDGILFRAGIELRYNLLEKMIGIILKGSTSFNEKTTYVGLGIAIGYYK